MRRAPLDASAHVATNDRVVRLSPVFRASARCVLYYTRQSPRVVQNHLAKGCVPPPVGYPLRAGAGSASSHARQWEPPCSQRCRSPWSTLRRLNARQPHRGWIATGGLSRRPRTPTTPPSPRLRRTDQGATSLSPWNPIEQGGAFALPLYPGDQPCASWMATGSVGVCGLWLGYFA
jgi:hypothetical protein